MNAPTPAPIPQRFRHAMRRQASTVSVVTCSEGERWHGMTATSVTSVCADPATLLVCINHGASLHAPLLAGGRFCVNLLSADQTEVAQAFSGALQGQARFGVGTWVADEHGQPSLNDAQATLSCVVVHSYTHGTHSIVLGRAVAVAVAVQMREEQADGNAPLLYHDGGYSVVAPLRVAALAA